MLLYHPLAGSAGRQGRSPAVRGAAAFCVEWQQGIRLGWLGGRQWASAAEISNGFRNLPAAACEYSKADAPPVHLALRMLFIIMAFPFQLLLETVLPQLLMPKDHKKHSKKDAASEDILDLAHASLKKFRKVTREISKLSPGQKLVGGLALAAAGPTYLATRDSSDEATPPAADPPRTTTAEVRSVPAAPPRKHPKRPRFATEE